MFSKRKAKDEPDAEGLQLVGLDEIKWRRLQHAYGAASDIPKLLRELASRDVERGEKALYQFYGNIYHQGTTYEATRYAVPFLRQILADAANPHRATILGLLVHLAFGHSYHDVHQWLSFNEQKRETAEFQAKIERELNDVELAHAAVREGVGQYLSLWNDAEPEIRLGAIYLASLFGLQNSEVVAALWGSLESATDRLERATLWLGLVVCPLQSEAVPRVEAAFASCEDELEKWALAALLLRWSGAELSEVRSDAAQVMIDALEASQQLQKAYDELPFSSEGLTADSAAQLLSLGSQARRFYRLICDKLRRVATQYEANSLLESIGPIFFGENSKENPVMWAELDEPQREILLALSQTDAVWGDGTISFGNLLMTLRFFGLPSERAALQALISIST